MFGLSANIKFDGFKELKPSSLKWNRDRNNICDSAMIVLPAICRLKGKSVTEVNRDLVPTGQQVPEGTRVAIYAGYDGKYTLRFKGFVKRINFKVPVEFDCEGYSYPLRKLQFSKSYKHTTVKQILEDIVEGTEIKLSPEIPNIPIPKVWFKNYTRLQVLEYLKEKCLLTVTFNFDELYVGLQAGQLRGEVKHRLNWNVIKDSELLFNADKEFATVNIELRKRLKTGHQNKGTSAVVRPGNVKVKRIALIEDQDAMNRIAEEEKKRLNNKGYSGRITAFLEPYVEPGMVDKIIDKSYEERNGRYYVDAVEGHLTPNGGGRQLITIGYYLGNG